MHIVNCVWGEKRNENLRIFSVKNENHYKKFNIIITSIVTDICNDILGHEDKIKYSGRIAVKQFFFGETIFYFGYYY